MTSDLAPTTRPTPIAAAIGVLATSLGKVLVWFVPIVLLVPPVLFALVAALGGKIEESVLTMSVANNAPAWFLFAMAATLTTQHLPVAVAHGMTRRLLAAALSWTLLAAAAVLTLVVPVGLLIESWAFDAIGWTLAVDDGLPSRLGALAGLMGNAFLRFAALGSIGALAAITYYRAGAWWGSLIALLSVALPGITVLYVFGENGAWIEPGLRTALVLTTIALVTLAHHALMRGATIRGKKA